MSTAFEDLQKLIEMFPKPEFSAFTVNYHGKELLLQNIPPEPKDSIFGARPGVPFGGLQVYVISNQNEPIVKWSDKDALKLYREMMGDLETEESERRDALKTLAKVARMDFSEMVRSTINIPTPDILEWFEGVRRPIEEAFDKLKPLLIPNPTEWLMPDKPIKQRRAPFYEKFLKRRK